MSLQIRMNGQILDLSPGAKVELEFVSPYLVYEDILASKASIPSLPITRRNRGILGFPDLLQNDAAAFRYPCEKYYNGQLIQTGVAVLTEAGSRQTGSEYSFTVVQALGEFFGANQYKPLNEIAFGSLALPDPLVKVVNSNNKPAVCFPTIVNPDYYGSNGGDVSYSGKMNDYLAGAYTASGPRVPFLFVDYLLGRIAAVTGTTLTGDYFTTRPELRELILFNTRALDGASTVTLARHLPELTLAEFFLELRKLFNLSFTFNSAERKLSIGFTSDIFKRPAVVDWSDKALRTYKKQPETNRRLQLGSELDSGDGLLKDKPAITADYLSAELAEPTGIAPLKSKFSTLLMDSASGTATCKQAGVTATLNQSANKFGARLLFYTGAESNNAAPTASSTLGDLSLYWNGVNGLARTFWAKNEELRSRWFYVARNMNLTELDLARLDFSQKVHINGVDYLPVKVTASLPVRAPASVLFMRV